MMSNVHDGYTHGDRVRHTVSDWWQVMGDVNRQVVDNTVGHRDGDDSDSHATTVSGTRTVTWSGSNTTTVSDLLAGNVHRQRQC